MTIVLPRCRFCGRRWKPSRGVNAVMGYCEACHEDRRALAGSRFDLRPIDPHEIVGPYLIRRKPSNP